MSDPAYKPKRLKFWHQRRYTAWYVPQYRIEDGDYSHSAEDDRLRDVIRLLKCDIFTRGLQNPLMVTRFRGKEIIHPGKCRAKALRGMGRTYSPAVVVNNDEPRAKRLRGYPEAVRLTNQEQAQAYFKEDCVVEMDHRFFCVKKKRG